MQQAPLVNGFVSVENIRLAYYEANPDKKNTIFFIHGNSSASRTWQLQLASAALSDWRLIAFDLPAHGLSDPFQDYNLTSLGRLLAAAIKTLSPDTPFLLAGLSLGTNVLSETLRYDIRPAGLALIGSCIFGGAIGMEQVFKPDIDIHAAFTDEVSMDELESYWRTGGMADPPDSKNYLQFAEDYFAVKDNFRSRMFAGVQAGNLSDEIALLQQNYSPILVIFGKEDGVNNIDYLDHAGLRLWQDTVFKLPGAGHFANIDKPEDTSRLLGDYAIDVFK